MDYTQLPAVNATLNSIAFCFLIAGFIFIRQGERVRHRNCMVAAFGCSILFLISYVVYHLNVGSVPFEGQGLVRKVYFAILITHIPLAALVPVLASITLFKALRERFEAHRRIARWTLPIWLYVSVTGVAIYWMLYHL